MYALLVDEQGAVGARRGEAQAMKMVAETLEPCPRRLLESIEGLDEQADMIGAVGVDETSRLMAVDAFRQIAVQECILDVELMNRPASSRRKMQHRANGGWLDHRREGLMEVNPGSLREPADNPSCFASLERTIWVELVLEEPLAGDDIGMCWPWNECPCPIGLQGVEFFLHCRMPRRVS